MPSASSRPDVDSLEREEEGPVVGEHIEQALGVALQKGRPGVAEPLLVPGAARRRLAGLSGELHRAPARCAPRRQALLLPVQANPHLGATRLRASPPAPRVTTRPP